jgi:hypothetical protein
VTQLVVGDTRTWWGAQLLALLGRLVGVRALVVQRRAGRYHLSGYVDEPAPSSPTNPHRW